MLSFDENILVIFVRLLLLLSFFLLISEMLRIVVDICTIGIFDVDMFN